LIPRFAHVRPDDLEGAFAAHAAAGGDGTWYAGGTELLQVMKAGFAAFTTLIDLKGIDELRGIDLSDDGSLRIGGAVTHREVERSPTVAAHVPGLARLARRIANVRVRNTGTIGGNLAFAEPHSDPATFLLACEAEVELAGPTGRRRLAIDELVVGPLMTLREPEEVIVAIHIPAAGPGTGRSYAKVAFFERPAASVAVRLAVREEVVADARIAAGSFTNVPMLLPDVAATLVGIRATEADLATAVRDTAGAFEEVEVIEDISGRADYKRHLAGRLLEQASVEALEEAVARA
jgi:carbon-monoxide dehydrogenase medium subunit